HTSPLTHNSTATTQLYTLSLHDALPISPTMEKQVRSLFEQYGARIVVYGESITCDVCIVRSPEVIQDWSKFLPTIKRVACLVIIDRKSTRLNSSHVSISYAVFCLKKKIH